MPLIAVIDIPSVRGFIRSMFVDYVEIEITAGHGGAGSVHFHTEKFIPKGGPDGGDGGRGGDVIMIADPNLSTLLDFRYRKKYEAENGHPGEGGQRSGKAGESVTIKVPVGTVVKDLNTGESVVDLDKPHEPVVIATGGRGGKGNSHFKSSTHQSPRFSQPGEPGIARTLGLELKLLADVGLVGQPNAGKSTILAALSAARPKIADYPFTTLVPNLGIVPFREFKSCVMADIPGLIEGASQGKGLGHQFLRHIQRTRVLLYIIDVNEPDIVATRELLEREMGDFDSTLLTRPSFTILTKIDTVDDKKLASILKKLPKDYLAISAVARRGLDTLLQKLEGRLDALGPA